MYSGRHFVAGGNILQQGATAYIRAAGYMYVSGSGQASPAVTSGDHIYLSNNGNITASGNISSSGTITANNINGTINGGTF
jgi:hypothetical protein